jgi:hypothetical protein
MMDQVLPVLDAYCRTVWPAVITVWLVMGAWDLKERIQRSRSA